jgi:hypothetical protein
VRSNQSYKLGLPTTHPMPYWLSPLLERHLEISMQLASAPSAICQFLCYNLQRDEFANGRFSDGKGDMSCFTSSLLNRHCRQSLRDIALGTGTLLLPPLTPSLTFPCAMSWFN